MFPVRAGMNRQLIPTREVKPRRRDGGFASPITGIGASRRKTFPRLDMAMSHESTETQNPSREFSGRVFLFEFLRLKPDRHSSG